MTFFLLLHVKGWTWSQSALWSKCWSLSLMSSSPFVSYTSSYLWCVIPLVYFFCFMSYFLYSSNIFFCVIYAFFLLGSFNFKIKEQLLIKCHDCEIWVLNFQKRVFLSLLFWSTLKLQYLKIEVNLLYLIFAVPI